MYLTIEETAEYLEVSEAYIEKLIQQKRSALYLTENHISFIKDSFKRI